MNKYIFAEFSQERKADRLGEGEGKTKDRRRTAEAELKHALPHSGLATRHIPGTGAMEMKDIMSVLQKPPIWVVLGGLCKEKMTGERNNQ